MTCMQINLRSIDLNLLTVFDGVMREGNLSAAADALGMTQPAVSNAVSRLRLTFDQRVVHPEQRPVDVSPEHPEATRVVRGDEVLIAHDNTRIETDDHIILFMVDKKHIVEVEKLFQVSAIFI